MTYFRKTTEARVVALAMALGGLLNAPIWAQAPEPLASVPTAPALAASAPDQATAAPPAVATSQATPVVKNCAALTDNAMALDLKVATQTQTMAVADQIKTVEESIRLWTEASLQCDDKARDRARRNLSEGVRLLDKLSEQSSSGPQCESGHKDAASLQDLARQALSERRFLDAAAMFRKAEDAWDIASERCIGTQQEVAQRRREQSNVDGHNAEYCAPVFELARDHTLKYRNLPGGMPREEKQDLAMGVETLWRDAMTRCKGPVVDTAKTQAQNLARERGTPWLSRYPVGTQAPKPIPVLAVAAAPSAALANAAPAAAAPAATGAFASLTSALSSVGAAVTSTVKSSVSALTTPSVPLTTPEGLASAPVPKALPGQPIAQAPEFVVGTVRYVGNFTKDPATGEFSGAGKLTWANGDTYEGALQAGQRHGAGVFVWANGQSFDGQWHLDKPAPDKAAVKFANGNHYDGATVDGIPQGEGRMRYASGDSYEGQFQAGSPQGAGVYVWKNSQRYEGAWVQGRPEGRGKLRFANGNVYEGSVRQGAPHGEGRLTFPTGEVYTGQMVTGVPEGVGTFEWPNGDRYVGQWKSGKKHGKGVFTWKNGERWEGLYEEDVQIN